jgi:peptidyl-prolyl cis-trans isomerase SurA
MLRGLKYGLLVFAALAFSAWAGTVLVDAVAAQVGDKPIMVSDVMAVVEVQQLKMQNKLSDEELKKELRKTYKEALDALIERQLILDAYQTAGKDAGRKIPEQFIDERIETIINDVFKGDRVAVMTELQKNGMTFEEWRNEVRNQIIVMAMRKSTVEQNIKVSPQAMRERYEKNIEKYRTPEKVKLRMIMLKKGETDDEKAKKRAEADDLVVKLKAGDDFAALAKKVSQDSNAENGGEWDWILPGALREDLAKAVASLKVDQVSDVIETPDGFYIIKCEGKTGGTAASFEESQPEIERELRQEQGRILYDAWIGRLKKSVSIKAFDDTCPL